MSTSRFLTSIIRTWLVFLLLVTLNLCSARITSRPQNNAIISSLAILSSPSFLTPNILGVQAYVPAVPVDDTTGLNLTDDSRLNLKWNPDAGSGGVYSAGVSYQLEADEPTPGADKGALLHFTEEEAGDNITTLTPWIAMIECRNWTHASDYWDIFTLARDRGAVAALLYTTVAQSCLINQEYLDDFEKPLNVFATKSRASATLIEAQFNATQPQFWHYNESLLNQSYEVVNASLEGNTVPTKTYLIATLVARGSQGQATAYPTATSSPTAPQSGTPRNRSVPMIILYCAAGIIGVLILSVVLTGAVRALRHPERYGPNADLGDRPPPASTAAGIGQAILDTFPVIKFDRPRRAVREKTAYPSFANANEQGDTSHDQDLDGDYAESSYAGSTLQHLKHRDPESPGMEEDGKAIEMVEKRSSGRERRDSTSRPVSTATLIGSAGHASADNTSSNNGNNNNNYINKESPVRSGVIVAGNNKDPEIAAAAKAFAEQRRSWIQNHMQDKRFAAAKAEGASASANVVAPPAAASSRTITPVRKTQESSGMGSGTPAAVIEEREEERDDGDEEEVCPICLLEFEEGDEVRVLPCQLAHSFHKECIDPWLLEVSSSCPLCRKDFAAAANQPNADTTASSIPPAASATTTTIPNETDARPGRFGRYLAFVRRERRRHDDHDGEDAQGEGLQRRRSRRRRDRWEQSGPGPF